MHRHKHKHAHSEIESHTNTNIGCMRRNIRLPQKWAFVLFDRFVMRNHSSNNVSLPTSNVAVVCVLCMLSFFELCNTTQFACCCNNSDKRQIKRKRNPFRAQHTSTNGMKNNYPLRLSLLLSKASNFHSTKLSLDYLTDVNAVKNP